MFGWNNKPVFGTRGLGDLTDLEGTVFVPDEDKYKEISALKSDITTQLGDIEFTLLCKNKQAIKYDYVVIKGRNVKTGAYCRFAVYRSFSQIIWRFGVIVSQFEKFSDYTCTTQIHPLLQEFIETQYENIPVREDTDIIFKQILNYKFIQGEIKRCYKNKQKLDLNMIYDTLDTERKSYTSDLILLSSGKIFGLGSVTHREIMNYIDNIDSEMENCPEELIKQQLDEINTYLPKNEDGTFKRLTLEGKLEVMSKYLSDKLTVVPNNTFIEYYLDPAIGFMEAINVKENLDLLAEEDYYSDPYLGGEGYNSFTSPRGRAKNANEIPKFIEENFSLFNRSPALLSVGLVSKDKAKTAYRLYYFDYRYRNKHYMIPLNIIYEGIDINIFGLPSKYISLNSYAGKILEYLRQTDIKAGNKYDVYHISKDKIYVFVGDVYNKVWPLNKVARVSNISRIEAHYKPLHKAKHKGANKGTNKANNSSFAAYNRRSIKAYNLPKNNNIRQVAEQLRKGKLTKRPTHPILFPKPFKGFTGTRKQKTASTDKSQSKDKYVSMVANNKLSSASNSENDVEKAEAIGNALEMQEYCPDLKQNPLGIDKGDPMYQACYGSYNFDVQENNHVANRNPLGIDKRGPMYHAHHGPYNIVTGEPSSVIP